eukprot:GFYU01039921.1.p1 GENE.GFYU01039921.1~~GFYU01039921.1.p1  ORF type:complete len:131 (+),score=21.47 GFYU01039921.1:116-508(+)
MAVDAGAAIASAFGAAAQAVASVALVCFVCVYMSLKGMLSAASRKELNKILAYLFLPALLLGKVIESVSADAIQHWWALPVMSILTIAVGSVVANVAARVMCLERREALVFTVSSAFPNTVTLPVAVLAR